MSSDLSEAEKRVFGENAKRDPDGKIIEQGIGSRTEDELEAIEREKLQAAELVLKLEPGLLKALHVGAAKARQTVHTFATDILAKGLPAQGSA